MPNVIITGAGSGCGRGFVEAFSRNPSNTIFAIDRTFGSIVTSTPASCRDAERCDSVHSLSDKHRSSCVPTDNFQNKLETEHKQDVDQPRNHGTVFTHKADLSSEADVASLSTWLSSFEVNFDIVIHCAGVRGLVPSPPVSDQASIATPYSLGRMDASTMLHIFISNALASFLFLRAILHFCRRCSSCGTRSQDEGEAACSACLSATKILVLGSRRGSMTASSALGCCYAYRASKAAQHAIVRSLVADAPDII